MTGFLEIDRLRALEVSQDRWDAIAQAPRPRLIAEWHVASDGRLACRWLRQNAELLG